LKVIVESRQLKKGTSTSTFEITLLSSPHHIEVSPSDAGNADRFVVMELIKEVAQSLPLDITEDIRGRSHPSAPKDKLQRGAMEKEPDSASARSSSSSTPSEPKGLFKGTPYAGPFWILFCFSFA
jgi:hypothetical protein